MKRHIRDSYFIVGEGILSCDEKKNPICQKPSTIAELRKFRFSRLGEKGVASQEPLRLALATAMTAAAGQPDSGGPTIPAGFTYLGQFIDHDLTLDNTSVALGEEVTVAELVQGRSPALDLDSLYGRGPRGADSKFYTDGIHLKMGTTAAVNFPANDPITNRPMQGFDLPRVGVGSTKAERRAALIPDRRNDENLIVAQLHLAFIRFHNRVVDTLAEKGVPGILLFEAAREKVVKHYQWMIRTDFLPRIVDPAIVDDVFKHRRRFFEAHPHHDDRPTMPVEFSIAAYRVGHSMIRAAYQWNRVFRTGGPGPVASLGLLFGFSGTSGTLSAGGNPSDPEAGAEFLPTNWIADFRRLFDFGEAGRNDLKVPATDFNVTKRIDTQLVNPLKTLPLGSFGGIGAAPPPDQELNLAFRNLTRANMVHLASGQQMAKLLEVKPLSAEQILEGNNGAVLSGLTAGDKAELTANTPLWFYILREAEFSNGRLSGVGGRIVAEVFHRAMEDSRISILRHPGWRPTLGPDAKTFRMVDMLLFGFEGKEELLNPLGD